MGDRTPVPVDHDPFAGGERKPVAVDHDPFASASPGAKPEDRGWLGGMAHRYTDEVHNALERVRQDYQGEFGPRSAAEKAEGKRPASSKPSAKELVREQSADAFPGDLGGVLTAALGTGPIRALTNTNSPDASALLTIGGLAAPIPGPKGERATVKPVTPKPPSARKAALRQNVEDLEAIGVKPSLAVASPSKATRGATQALASNIFLGPFVRQAIDRTSKGFRSALDQAIGSRPAPSAAVAGEGVKSGLQRYAQTSPTVRQALRGMTTPTRDATTSAARSIPSRKLGLGNKAENLYSRAEGMVGSSAKPIDLPHTRAAIGDVFQEFHDPNLQELFQHSELKRIDDALKASNGRLSWNDAIGLRTKIRETLQADPALRHKVSEAQINGVYSALTQDLQEGAGKLGGPKARKAFEQANQFYRTGMDRVNNVLSQYYGPKASGETVFHDLMRSAQEGGSGDLRKLNAVKRSLNPDEWHDFSSSVIDQMGRALPGQRTPETDFSFSTFLTNFNKLDTRGARSEAAADSGLKTLFSGAGRDSQLPLLRKLAKVAEEMRELEKFRNASQSGALMGNIATGSFLTDAIFSHHPAAAVGSFLIGNAAAKALESPTFVRWLAGVPTRAATPSVLKGELSKLKALSVKDPELREAYRTISVGLGSMISQQGAADQQPAQ